MKRTVRLGLQAAVTVALVGLLVANTDFAAVGGVLGRLSPIAVVALAAVMLVQGVASGVRWHRLLALLGEHPGVPPVIGDTFVGMSYNMVLPTSVGGDFVRAWRNARRLERAAAAWSTVLFERVAGVVSLALFGAAAVGLGSLEATGAVGWTALVLGVAGVVVFLGLEAPFALLLKVLRRRLTSPPAILAGIREDLGGVLASTRARALAIAWSLVCTGLGLLFAIVAALFLGATDAVRPLVIGLPIIFVVSLLPVTINGLGLREGLYVVVLGQLGVDESIAMAIALLSLAGLLFQALVGLLVMAAEQLRSG